MKRREGGHGGGHDSVCVPMPTRADAALIPVGQSHHPSHCRTQSTHLTYVQYWIEIGVDGSVDVVVHDHDHPWLVPVPDCLGSGSGEERRGQRWTKVEDMSLPTKATPPRLG
jgi:hypothetical protein